MLVAASTLVAAAIGAGFASLGLLRLGATLTIGFTIGTLPALELLPRRLPLCRLRPLWRLGSYGLTARRR